MLGTLYLGVRGMDSGSGLLVMAPWISDLENRSHRLPMPLRDEVVAESGRNLDRFSEIVATMRRHDVQVRIMTAPLNSTFKRDWNSEQETRTAFIRRLVDAGAEIRYHSESHVKLILSPSGRTERVSKRHGQCVLPQRRADDLAGGEHDAYPQSRHHGERLWSEGRPAV